MPKLVGILGESIGYTLSPRMHNHAFKKLGLDYVYEIFDFKRTGRDQDFKNFVASLRKRDGFAGMNVTVPYKEAILGCLDGGLSGEAQKIGAVNTVIARGGKLAGDNTDGKGFLAALKEAGKFDPGGKRAVLVGAGGSARAIAVSLLEAGIKSLSILNRTPDRAEDLRKHLERDADSSAVLTAAGLSREQVEKGLRACDLFINATQTGMDSIAPDLPPELLVRSFVFDIVYAQETPLIRAAQAAGAAHLCGVEMLIRQGALSFQMWTGKKPPVELLREALNKI